MFCSICLFLQYCALMFFLDCVILLFFIFLYTCLLSFIDVFFIFVLFFFFFFVFKQKTAYEMRISDWSSDVCSSDLDHVPLFAGKRVLTPAGKKGDADGAVIAALAEAGTLLAKGKLTHSYPHSWRSKAPLIFRNTAQWFI